MFIRTIATQPDSTNPLAPWNRPEPVFVPVLCGSQPDGDGECGNEVPKGCLCEACKEYNLNHA